MPNIFWGTILESIGSLMVAYTVVKVHYRFWKEHRIDEKVFREMRFEQFVGLFGICLMLAGYLVQLINLA